MKREVAQFVARCLTCQQVKVEPQKSVGLLQPLPILVWKWEHISMDFVSGLSRTLKGCDAIWVIVDRLTKSVHFLLVKTGYSIERLARLYIDEIVRLHGVGDNNTSSDLGRTKPRAGRKAELSPELGIRPN